MPPEMLLQLCQSAEPNPWYPRTYCQERQIPRESLDAGLDQLRLGGFIELTPWIAGPGQGYRLTPAGRALLESPRALERLAAGELPIPRVVPSVRAEPVARPANSQRWLQIEDVFLSRRPAVVSMALAIICAAFFLWGLALAMRVQATSAYLAGFMGGDQAKYGPILDQIGSVSVLDVVAGRWWRLLTANFVHAGALHIGMNLYFLYAFGPMTERMLGSWRYALFCLAAAIGSTTVGVYFQIALVGFSGIDCGLIGAILAWTMLNRRYLSRQAYAGIMRMVIQNVVLLAIVSLASGVSWSGHLGGAVLGFLASIVLTLNRFGSLPVKIPTLLAALALPALCVVGFKPVAEKTGKWAYWETEFENREVDTFNDELSVPINKDIRDADNAVDHLHINVLLSRLPIGGDVKAAIETLKTQHEILAADEKKLAPVRAYRSERVIEAKAALLERIQTRITLFERQREALEKPSDSDRSEIRELTQRVNSADARWEKVRAGT